MFSAPSSIALRIRTREFPLHDRCLWAGQTTTQLLQAQQHTYMANVTMTCRTGILGERMSVEEIRRCRCKPTTYRTVIIPTMSLSSRTLHTKTSSSSRLIAICFSTTSSWPNCLIILRRLIAVGVSDMAKERTDPQCVLSAMVFTRASVCRTVSRKRNERNEGNNIPPPSAASVHFAPSAQAGWG
jgi:hypothetical protein